MAFNPVEHLSKLQNKEYLEIKWRIAWFRDKYPQGSIETTLLHIDLEKQIAVFKATVKDTEGGIGEGHGSETVKDFRDFIEKAETKAIGRALAVLGYGTQFAPEIEEGERIADSPVERKGLKHLIAPSEVDAIRTAWASAYNIASEQVMARWAKYKPYALGSQIADSDLTTAHLAKMSADIDKQKATSSNGASGK